MPDEIVLYEITQDVLVGSTRVIVDYTMDKGGKYEYRDALHFTAAEWPDQTPATLEDEMRARHNRWIAAVTAPRPEPTAEDKAAQLASMADQVTSLKAQIAASTTPDVAVPILQGLVAATNEQIANIGSTMVSMDQALQDGTLVVKG